MRAASGEARNAGKGMLLLADALRSLTCGNVVELRGIEPRTSSMRTKRATNCATAPGRGVDREPSATIAAALPPGGPPHQHERAAHQGEPTAQSTRKESPASTGTPREASISAATAISSPKPASASSRPDAQAPSAFAADRPSAW